MEVDKAGAGGHSDVPSLVARVEGLLFVAPGPIAVSQLAAVLGVSARQVEQCLEALAASCHSRGFCLQRSRLGVQLTSSPELAEEIERFLNLETSVHLTQAAVEVLAIIAYRQPTTKPQVEAIRGVDSESPLHTLLRFGLIEEVGRSMGPGRPILYATTTDFLQHFGLKAIDELPPLGIEEPQVGPTATPVSAEDTGEKAADG